MSSAIKKSSSPASSVKRCLFGTPSRCAESNDSFVKKLLDEIHQRYCAKWEFDFERGLPLAANGKRFAYKAVDAARVPRFYRPDTTGYEAVYPDGSTWSSLANKSPQSLGKYHYRLEADDEFTALTEGGEKAANEFASIHDMLSASWTDDLAEELSENIDPLCQKSSSKKMDAQVYAISSLRGHTFTSTTVEPEVNDDEEELPLIHDSTSSSGGSSSSLINSSITTTALGSQFDEEEAATTYRLASATTTTQEAEVLARDCDDVCSTQVRRRSWMSAMARRDNSVTPQQPKITDFWTQRRKRLQSSVRKADTLVGCGMSPSKRFVVPSPKKRKIDVTATPHRRIAIPVRRRLITDDGWKRTPTD